ncbi:MAG: hypothetical protein ACTHL1_10075, partial [Burkholderiaceae bacterium]
GALAAPLPQQARLENAEAGRDRVGRFFLTGRLDRQLPGAQMEENDRLAPSEIANANSDRQGSRGKLVPAAAAGTSAPPCRQLLSKNFL